MKKYAYETAEGNIRLISAKVNPLNYLPEGATLRDDLDAENLPDAKYKECWVDNGSGGVKVDLPKARIQKEAEIRAERDRILKLTDEAFLIALSKGESTTDIEADKVILRDMMADVTTGLSSKMAITTIDAYDGFADVTLAGTYE